MHRSFKEVLKSGHRGLQITAVAAACLTLAACQTTGSNQLAASQEPQSYGSALRGGEMSPSVKYWAEQFQKNPNDVKIALSLSRELRKDGQYDDAIGIMMRSTTDISSDPRVLAELGKIIVERGSPEEGLALLDQAGQQMTTDWTIMSARGVALEQLERHEEAQKAFEKALTYSPGNPTALTNLGLSLASQGRLGEAENMLRKAYDHPDAGSAVALNLALIIGLKGDFEESERIARGHLPPASVEENVRYLKALLSQQARWQRPLDEDFKDPKDTSL